MPKETPFYGREDELKRLRLLLKKTTSSLVVVKGRRRIGKSRLIVEFTKGTKAYIFTGLPPTETTTAQTQREYFALQMERLLGVKKVKNDDWAYLFWRLAQLVKSKKVVLVLDEINWIGSLDDTFLGKLKSAWDTEFKNNPKLLMILSGSMSSWIDENIMSSTGFMGRVSLDLTLDELPLPICNLFWRKKASRISAYEKFKLLSVTGGVPRYLEEIDPDSSAEDNIYNLAFRKGGLLVEEFDRIFSDLFSKRFQKYKQIVELLAEQDATSEQIRRKVRLEPGGTISKYLEDLVETGYISRDNTWKIKNGAESNLCKFRLKDNYLRFYLKYIEPRRGLIEKNRVVALPAWTSIMGLQFENLVLHNFHKIYSLLGIDPKEVIYDNPYFQRSNNTQAGCQIDYLIQTKFNTLYLCEVKFSKDPIGSAVIKEVEQKIERLLKPKNFSIRPVLIHVNGVTDSVAESEFFAKIIDFSSFLG
ncbi:MAG: AAA family ATPase [Verrucomicrobia bacterium]|nr:AAA family ATPase [Verrucomicrobiota bacterium]